MEHPKLGKAIVGGLVGTIMISIVMYFVAPMMLGKPMDIAAMLGSMMGNSWTLGFIAHFMMGTLVFPIIYVFVLFGFLPGAPWLKGVLWGLGLWMIAQVMVMPMMGAGFFSSNAGGIMAVMGSLMGHVIYGASLGLIANGSNK